MLLMANANAARLQRDAGERSMRSGDHQRVHARLFISIVSWIRDEAGNARQGVPRVALNGVNESCHSVVTRRDQTFQSAGRTGIVRVRDEELMMRNDSQRCRNVVTPVNI